MKKKKRTYTIDIETMSWKSNTWTNMPPKKKKYKKSERWQPYGDVRVGDHTDIGVVIEVQQHLGEMSSSTCGTLIKVDRTPFDDSVFKGGDARIINHNYTRMRRQIVKLLTAPEMAPARKSAIRDLAKFWEIDKKEAFERAKDPNYLREQDERLARFEKSVVTRKTSDKFGI